MAGIFHGAGLMYGDVPGLGGHDALIVPEHGGDDGGVGLGAAGKQVHIGPGAGTGFADTGTGSSGITVFAVPGLLVQVRALKGLQDGRMGTLGVVAGKGNHKLTLSSTGQWSEPKISLWMSVETRASFKASDTTK